MRYFFFCVIASSMLFFDGLAQGKLFIIGGGKRPADMVRRMIKESGVEKSGYIMILPFASEEQDSAIFYAKKQFSTFESVRCSGIMCKKGEILSKQKIDSISNAAFIYIPGGDQVKFMNITAGTEIETAIYSCFKKGGMVGGTSAGAAVMSQKMITGVELKYKSTSEDTEKDGFRTIESQNIELAQGLGFLKNAIIDQHFIKRKRQNRLMAVSIENPKMLCVGIDEATAIFVKDGIAEVIGDSQVLLLTNTDNRNVKNGVKLSSSSMKMRLLIAGQKFKIK